MARKSLFRPVRTRFSSAVIWTMVPLAAISGRSVSGCLSPTGHFDPNCECWTGSSSGQASATVCRCHCSKCGGASCCCKSKAPAGGGDQAKGSGIQDGRCHAVSLYGLISAVTASKTAQLSANPLSADLAVVPTAQLCSITTISSQCVGDLNTGPPPDNLIVQLHHWII